MMRRFPILAEAPSRIARLRATITELMTENAALKARLALR
jgi:hypothetical protein